MTRIQKERQAHQSGDSLGLPVTLSVNLSRLLPIEIPREFWPMKLHLVEAINGHQDLLRISLKPIKHPQEPLRHFFDATWLLGRSQAFYSGRLTARPRNKRVSLATSD